MQDEGFREWLELMGHRRLAGLVSEATIGGASFIRIDIPSADGAAATQLYSPQAVYCMTPTSEDTVRRVATGNQPAPVSRWEPPAPPDHPLDLTDWDRWSEELRRVGKAYGLPEDPDVEAYRVFFADGMTPAKAFFEDLSRNG